MDNRRSQLNVAHALAADSTVSHLDPATIANHSLIFHSPIFPAGTFPVLFGSENALAKKPVFLRTVGAVVNRFGLFDFAKGPTANVSRAGQRDFHRCVVIDPVVSRFACTNRSTGDTATCYCYI